MKVRDVLRNVLAVSAGLLAGMGLNMSLITLNTSVLFPAPAGIDMNDGQAFNAYIESLPTEAFLVVLLAHLVQSFVGGWIAARLAASRPMALALTIGIFSLLGGVMAMTMITGPAWLMVELPLHLVVAWLAGRIEVRRRFGLDSSAT